MYCIYCGKKLPDDARHCSACGRKIEQEQESEPAAQSAPPAEKPMPAATTEERTRPSRPSPLPEQTLPYSFGKFLGWFTIIGGTFGSLAACGSVAKKDSEAGWAFLLLFALWVAILAVGHGILHRKPWVPGLMYVNFGLAATLFLVALIAKPSTRYIPKHEEWVRWVAEAALYLLVAGVYAYYFHKRRHEFKQRGELTDAPGSVGASWQGRGRPGW